MRPRVRSRASSSAKTTTSPTSRRQASAASFPSTLAARLRRSHFLFLGYGLIDWSLRVFLQRLWPDGQADYRSWAVQPAAGAVEREFWKRRGVEPSSTGRSASSSTYMRAPRRRGATSARRSRERRRREASARPYKGLTPYDETRSRRPALLRPRARNRLVVAKVRSPRG